MIKKIKKKTSDERLFYHDVTNHLHGLSLFLESKEQKSSGLTSSELSQVKEEIVLLQALFKEHSSFNHRHLEIAQTHVREEDLTRRIDHLLMLYLPADSFLVTTSLKGSLNGEVQVPWSLNVFSRIITNLVKNIAENSGREVLIEIELTSHSLTFLTRNLVLEQNKQVHRASLGLKSTAQLCHECGGEFSYEKRDGSWFNQVILPLTEKAIIKKAA